MDPTHPSDHDIRPEPELQIVEVEQGPNPEEEFWEKNLDLDIEGLINTPPPQKKKSRPSIN